MYCIYIVRNIAGSELLVRSVIIYKWRLFVFSRRAEGRSDSGRSVTRQLPKGKNRE